MKLKFHPNRHHLLTAATLAASLGFVMPQALAATAHLPTQQHQGTVTYLSGGIGDQEAQAMKQAAAKYPLEVEFLKKEAHGHAAYLAGDRIAIRDHAGKTVLQTTSNGPFLLAKLPPGHYMISATNHKIGKERSVEIAAGKQRDVVFEW